VFQTQFQFKSLLSLKCNGVEAAAGTGADGAIAGGTGADGGAAGTADAVGMEAGGGAQALASWLAAAVAP